LARKIFHQDIDMKFLSDLEEKDNLFPRIDFRVFQNDTLRKQDETVPEEWDERR